MDELEKIDELRRRFNIGYKEASDLLVECGGDLVAALIMQEERNQAKREQAFDKGPEMWDKVKDSVKEGSKKKILISKEGKTVAKIPAPVGALGVLGAIVSTPFALIAGAGTIAALANNYSFKLTDDNVDNCEQYNTYKEQDPESYEGEWNHPPKQEDADKQ